MDIKKQNFISVDGKSVKNSYDEYFTIGESISHEDKTVGIATILNFELDLKQNEVKVNTDKGYAHIDFIRKISQ